MVDLSKTALDNAIQIEVKKDGLTQRQSGDWQLRFTMAAIDMDRRLTEAVMGQRFVCVLVEIGDNEEPVNRKAEDRDKWRALGAMRQAGIRCKDPMFQAYLRETFEWRNVFSEEDAADAVRSLCNVLTRTDLDKPGFADARILWFDLDNKFQAWKARERYG